VWVSETTHWLLVAASKVTERDMQDVADELLAKELRIVLGDYIAKEDA